MEGNAQPLMILVGPNQPSSVSVSQVYNLAFHQVTDNDDMTSFKNEIVFIFNKIR